jgi:hypothetical protein
VLRELDQRAAQHDHDDHAQQVGERRGDPRDPDDLLREEERGEDRSHAGDRLHQGAHQADGALMQLGRYGG